MSLHHDDRQEGDRIKTAEDVVEMEDTTMLLDGQQERDRIATFKRTSPCRTTVISMGSSPRIGMNATAGDGNVWMSDTRAGTTLPQKRCGRDYLPSHLQIMTLLSKACAPGQQRVHFIRIFKGAKKRNHRTEVDEMLCKTPIAWIEYALVGGTRIKPTYRLRSLDDMFPSHCTVSDYQIEYYIMDVILNRHVRTNRDAEQHDIDHRDPNKVVTVWCYRPEELGDEFDHMFRTAILFLPQAGVFYCARERRKADAGVPNSYIPLDMSWLRMERKQTFRPRSGYSHEARFSYTFGADGYVKCFSSSKSTPGYPDFDFVSAWRISLDRTIERRAKRTIYRVNQCLDADGPMLAPNVFDGEDANSWPHVDLQQEYNRRLSSSNSAKKNGRHYASGCHHYRLPKDCWILDPWKGDENVDICVDVATVGRCSDRQSLVMIRNLLVHDNEEERESPLYDQSRDKNVYLFGALNHIAFANTLLMKQSGNGVTVRSGTGDVGRMYGLGTGVKLDGSSLYGYAANYLLPERLLRNMVKSLAHCGEKFFPQVLAVISDTEYDSGIRPISPMDGDPHKGRHVGFTIDTSINLGNSSHFDVHDASQGYGVWTEQHPGWGESWYFVMPNIHGRRPHETSWRGERRAGDRFAGLAIKLRHGVAISWDGRVIRHCTSLSHPDGWDYARVGRAGENPSFMNNLYGTFTAAKERVVTAGRSSSLKQHLEKAANEGTDKECDGCAHKGTAGGAKKRREE